MKKNVIGAVEKMEKGRNAQEDNGGKKMNVSEEMLTKNRMSMQSGKEDTMREKGRIRMKSRGTQRATQRKENRVRNGENVEKQ